jgi:hypothetical protein
MASVQIWRFTVTERRTGAVVKRVKVQAKRQADVLEALGKLRAPDRTLQLARHAAAGQIRRFNWETPLLKIVGVQG